MKFSCGFWSILWKKLKSRKTKTVIPDSKPEVHEIPEVHLHESDDILEQIKALGTGNLGSGFADMNFQGSIIHIEQPTQPSLERSNTKRSSRPKISVEKPPSERTSFAQESSEYQEPSSNTLRRKKEKTSNEQIKPLIDLTPTSVITKGALLDYNNKPPLAKSRPKSQTFEDGLLRTKSIKKEELSHSTSLRRKKSVKQQVDELKPSKSMSRKEVDLQRSQSKRVDDSSSSNNDDNVPLATTLSRSRSKKDLIRSKSRKDSKSKLIATDEDISDRPPDYDIEPVRSIRQSSNASTLDTRRSRTDVSRTKSQSRRRSHSTKREEVSDDDETPLANVALQALQQNLATNKPSRLR